MSKRKSEPKSRPKAAKLILSDPEGKALFSSLKKWAFPDSAVEEWRSSIKIDMEYVQDLDNDRLLVLLGSLIVENALDRILESLMPNFGGLDKNRDFTFSLRTDVVRALGIIPSKVLGGVDVIRGIRNDFVHSLAIDKFNKLKRPRLDSMCAHLRKFKDSDTRKLSHADKVDPIVKTRKGPELRCGLPFTELRKDNLLRSPLSGLW